MSEKAVMANIMTPSLAHRDFINAMRREVGHNRPGGCPYKSFLLMNSGSEGNAVADRIMDVQAGHLAEGRRVVGVSLAGSFHGRTFMPAVWTDSCRETYTQVKCQAIVNKRNEYMLDPVPLNDSAALRRAFERADAENLYIQCVVMESVMGEGNPGASVSPEFYSLARELTMQHNSMLLIDNIQAGLRCTGNLSIVDYPGFTNLPAPDFEVYSKAINAGQYPVSCLALSERALGFYKHGTYGNTMTGNPRACMVSAAVLNEITDDLRKNIVEMGEYAKSRFQELMAKYPQAITNVTGCGLLYAVQLNPDIFTVVALDGTETLLRTQGIGVIHGGENALRFTPHFRITKEELDLQVEKVEEFLSRTPMASLEKEVQMRKFFEDTIGDEEEVFITMTGHLFDTGLFNETLNVVEEKKSKARMMRMKLGSTVHEDSEVTLQLLSTGNGTSMTALVERLGQLAAEKDCEVSTNTNKGTVVLYRPASRL